MTLRIFVGYNLQVNVSVQVVRKSLAIAIVIYTTTTELVQLISVGRRTLNLS